MQLSVAALTDRGRVRDQNEDAVLTDVPLVAVADGMGGHEGGEVASTMALETLASWKERLQSRSIVDATQILRDAFAEANRMVWQKGQEDEGLSGMGTTLTAGWIEDNKIVLAHVGDSRAYLLREGELRQLTEDQTVAQELVRRGRISESELARSPHRHYLLQAIGGDPDQLKIVVSSVELKPGDRLLLATDGLYGMLRSADRIRDILMEHAEPEEACRVLVSEANTAGGEDNISVLVVDALPGESGEPGPGVQPAPRVAAPPPAETAPPQAETTARRRFLSWPVLAAAGVLVAIIAGVLLASLAADTLLVAERDGKVAILKGKQGDADSRARGEVVRVFEDEPVRRFSRTVREDLRVGIAVDSMAEAEQVISNLPRELGPQDTPAPSPTPGRSPQSQLRSTLPPRSPSP